MLKDNKNYIVKTNKKHVYNDKNKNFVIEAGDDGIIKINNKYLDLFVNQENWPENIIDFDFDIDKNIIFVTSESVMGIYIKNELIQISDKQILNIYKNDPIYNIKIKKTTKYKNIENIKNRKNANKKNSILKNNSNIINKKNINNQILYSQSISIDSEKSKIDKYIYDIIISGEKKIIYEISLLI